ncbi:FAD dependent oxidoreductase [Vibrio ponticus]|nr:FAD dependent oxidoreductase [Vibrio ponticus]
MSVQNEYIDSYYQATINPLPLQPELTQDIDVDVCIIGGGMTGLNAAIELRQRGYTVAVLESKRLAWGGSGRNGGQCLVGYCLGLRELMKPTVKNGAKSFGTCLLRQSTLRVIA